MVRTAKQHKLEQSPFYRLGTKSKLAKHLKTDKRVILLVAKKQPYLSFSKEVGEKVREIDLPLKELRFLQDRIKELLSRIETPEWLFSGKKGVSYIDNAKFHKDSPYITTCDIKSFYPNCTREKIFQIFKYTFKTTDDVAWILSRLLSFDEKVPTGSPSSQIIAFWAYYPTFCRIHKLTEQYGAKVSIYVDDITISSQKPIPNQLLKSIKERLGRVGHTIKNEKTRRYGKNEFKIVTGVAISPLGELKVPNKRRKKIINELIAQEKKDFSLKNSTEGKIRSAQQIEPDFMNKKKK